MKTDFSYSYLIMPKVQYQVPREKLKEALSIVKKSGETNIKSMRSFAGFIADLKNEETKKLLESSGFNVIKNKGIKTYLSQRHLIRPKQDNKISIDKSSYLHSHDDMLKGMSEHRLFNSIYVNTPTTGKNVTVAIIDSGVAPHPDLEGKIVASVDYVYGKKEPYDDMGHGTHVAGIVAGRGKLSKGKYRGIAPDAKIAALKVLGARDDLSIADVADNIINAINWCINNKNKFNIKAINMSLGLPIKGVTRTRQDGQPLLYDPFIDIINRAINSGITVVVSAGNDGIEGGRSIDNEPGIHPRVITVGAADDKNTPDINDDNLAPFSSQGPTPTGLVKPDVIAPGAKIMSLNVAGGFMDEHNKMVPILREKISSIDDDALLSLVKEMIFAGQLPRKILESPPDKIRQLLLQNLKEDPTDGPELNGSPAYIALDGTSMSSPYVAGVVADMAEANPNLTPDQIKSILMNTAIKLNDIGGENQQGKGTVDVIAAINAASTFTGKEVLPRQISREQMPAA